MTGSSSGCCSSAGMRRAARRRRRREKFSSRGSTGSRIPRAWHRNSRRCGRAPRLDCGRLAEEEWLDGAPVGFQEQRPKPPDVEERMAELLREYLEQGIVVEGSSASNNPLILIPKRNGTGWRLTLDCRALNEATPVEPPERPDRAWLLASVNPRSRFFSVLDLSNACLAIPLARSSWPRFAFTFQGRQFLFTRLPPTFHGTNSILHRRVCAVLAQLEPGAAPGVFHYNDDILVTGKSWRQAAYRTRRVLELIRSAGFKANPHKAQLVRREVNFLGVTIGAAGQRVPEEKVEKIRADCDALRSCSAGTLRSILGKFGSWRCFIPDYWELALPLQRLAEQGDGEWEWGWRQQLRQLMEALEAAPVLRFPDKSRPFLIRLSPHEETAGAALLQEKAGILLPVGHCSRILSRWNFSDVEMGCVAAVQAVQDFEDFTGPAPIVISDSMWNYLVRGEALGSGGSGLPEQWTLLLTSRGPDKRESQRIAIVPAPELQYLLSDVPEADVWFLAVESRGSSVGFAAVSLEERWLLGGCRGAWGAAAMELEALRELLEQHRSSGPLFLYSSCPALAARLERREREPGWNPAGNAWPRVLRWLRAFPGMLRVGEPGRAGSAERAWITRASARARAVAGSGRKIWEPSKYERQEIVARCHRRHEGVDGTLARVRAVASWEGDGRDVARWVRSCPTCRHPDADPDPGPQRAEGPWSCLWISLSKPLPRSAEGFCALLVVQDALSGWVDAFPLRRRAEPDVAQTLLREVFGNFGTVASVLLAPAPAWMWNSMSRAPLRGFWSRLERSCPHEAAERLWRVAQAAGKGWAGMLPLILAGIRSYHVRRDGLGPLLCVPGLPLESRWKGPAEEEADTGNETRNAGNNAGNEAGNNAWNELSWLRRTRLLPGYREHVEAALCQDPGSGLGGRWLGWTGGGLDGTGRGFRDGRGFRQDWEMF
ncbi:uncharacterized protein LOC125322985 isoform X3 [Corvus hawaiiensis]|uniref:uncharacterized protein LOC125322985 isoform X3 n=1 Tax=Corvus hawaiiensis TaxID=134902 RepID=UPI0020191044|nr:uncharacterized protein LOC125322985 isoform X3 [Corvus hawaiiensis]